MLYVWFALLTICGIGSLACYVTVIIKMFQHGDTGIAVTSLVLLLVLGLGIVVAFVAGWVRAGKYGIKALMLGWTVIVAGQIVFEVLFIRAASAPVP
jgi:hypothetical protein